MCVLGQQKQGTFEFKGSITVGRELGQRHPSVTWLIYIAMTVALSTAIFATTYESDKSMNWKLWFYGRP